MSKLLSDTFKFIRYSALSILFSGCVFQPADEAGFRRLTVIDPVAKKPMEAVYFYPSNTVGNTLSSFGPYHVSARNAVKMALGKFPLIVISHGNSGSLWSHHNLATALARQGNIVITLSHPGDNYKDQSGAGATSTIYGRPLQISAAITAVLNNPDISQHIDANKIAFIGFSSGGETGLLLAGGRIDPSRYDSYCESHQAEAMCLAKGHIKNDSPALIPESDPRIKAWVLMAPVSAPFSLESLKTFNKPVLIFTGDKDEELSWHQNAGELAKTLPSKPQLKVIPGAGHFVFLSPCSAELRAATPVLCEDSLGVDRTTVHSMIGEDISRFLNGIWQENGA
ncbi:alpha/beta hydrolase family protein [Pectobacterium carotovorum]|uniref:Dienelactone hydrolase n=1 Tax=Pectobacterium carotovorum TaxID=554 RepID=A0A419B1X3_PECCA|nr:alpha/beta fold hydrolase [Pectobacterium carotovorum]RJL55521.1 dienelactone hydrolase [Pectobacterium carotovorum]